MPSPRDTEVKIHGQHACRAVFARRPEDVLRFYVTEELSKPFGDLLSECARRKRPYRVVKPAELEKLTESKHHEGVCLVARQVAPRPLAAVLAEGRGDPAWMVALADVSNPHNVGAILRIAAHFGARAALLSGGRRLAPAAYRTAQGGAEWVECLPVANLPAALKDCRAAGFRVLATSSHGGRDLFKTRLPARAVVLLGSEHDGLPRPLLDQADDTVVIPGSGFVESLNVASAASVLIAELWRQRG